MNIEGNWTDIISRYRFSLSTISIINWIVPISLSPTVAFIAEFLYHSSPPNSCQSSHWAPLPSGLFMSTLLSFLGGSPVWNCAFHQLNAKDTKRLHPKSTKNQKKQAHAFPVIPVSLICCALIKWIKIQDFEYYPQIPLKFLLLIVAVATIS
jgi:hypothetical protein